MTNESARETLSKTIERFQTNTKEPVGVVHTWRNKLSALGNDNSRNYVEQSMEQIWPTLAFVRRRKEEIQIPERDEDMINLMECTPRQNVLVRYRGN
ncbi:hypothetical protein LOD99_14280 [Oopsacas minuta]|uniref:Uncharacterized protein n=1 Tax=Oopsacas minuta TaxID=111878 RepID=A0AAV7KGC6_9METZ|nr:hypothetical protein LOD99_14280 [Oopsacas minuta]